MLRSISWGQFGALILIGLTLCYTYLHRHFKIFQPLIDLIKRPTQVPVQLPPDPPPTDPPPDPQMEKPPIQNTLFIVPLLTATAIAAGATPAAAQTADGNAGINQANTLIRSYFTTATQLMYAISAVIGLAGAIYVYVKMLRGHHDTQAAAAAWFGACIFIAIVATVIQFFFGL